MTYRATPAALSSVPFSRLLRAELRKLTDTRANRWLLAATLAATPLVTAVMLFVADPMDLTYADLVNITSTPTKYLLPVLGILTVTSEWSQGTGLLTFTLEPNRHRVLLAKSAATGVLGVVVLLVTFCCSAGGNAFGEALLDGDGSWAGATTATRDISVVLLTVLAQGVAFGMLCLASAAAIVAFYLLPTLSGFLFGPQFGFAELGQWIDLNQSQGQLYDHSMTGEDWASIVVSGLVWVGIPAVLGMLRAGRGEIEPT